MSYRNGLVALSFLLFGLVAFAQPDELHRDVKEQLEKPLVGPNSSYYDYSVLSFGAVVPFAAEDSLVDKPGFAFATTSRYKFKLTSWYSLGVDLRYTFSSMPLSEDSISNPFRPVGGFDKQSFRNHRVDLGGFMRFNFDKRGNYLGKFLDLGGFAGFNFSQRIRTKIDTDPQTNGGAKAVKNVARKLQFTEKLVYGVDARIGLNKVEFGLTYRLSDFFKSSNGRFESIGEQAPIVPDMPRLTVRIGFAMPSGSDL